MQKIKHIYKVHIWNRILRSQSHFFIILVVIILIGAACNTDSQQNSNVTKELTERPNILMIWTDQLRFDALSAYGAKAVHTPNIDRLAKEGVKFTQAYASNPICTPSKASMMTGLHLPGHGVYKLHDILPDDQILFPKRLQKKGYQTTLVGKLHVSGLWHEAEERHPNDGFDNYFWSIDPGLNLENPMNDYAQWVKERDPNFYSKLLEKGKAMRHFPEDLHYSRWVSETTIEQLEKRDPNKPFFNLMSFFDPHDPYFDHPRSMREMVVDSLLPEPVPTVSVNKLPEGIQREFNKSQIIKNSETFQAPVKELRKGYYASIAFLDQEIGRVLDYLDRAGLSENTIVIFVSDHGDMLYDRGLFTKGAFFYDPAIRVPFMIRYPGKIKEGTVYSDLVQPFDITATILSEAGYSDQEIFSWMPESMDLVELLKKGKDYHNYRDYAVCAFRNTGYGPGHKYFDPPIHATMYRKGRYKLNVYHTHTLEGVPGGELYDMKNDPYELNNLWNSSKYQEIKSNLTADLTDWMVQNSIRYLGTRGGEKFKAFEGNYYGDKENE